MIVKKAGKFNEKDALQYMHQLMLAVKYIHQNNIIHRNIKPENILLEQQINDDGSHQHTLKLIGFGSSSILNPTDKLKQAIGSSYYVAPEVIDRSYD